MKKESHWKKRNKEKNLNSANKRGQLWLLDNFNRNK